MENEISVDAGILRLAVRDPFAFVLMPFASTYDDVYDAIKTTAEERGFRCNRVDEQHFQEHIVRRIYDQIKEADVIIADLTGDNPNVFYELGYARALDKKIVLLTQQDGVPFDLSHYQRIVYSVGLDQLRGKLGDYLHSMVQERQVGGQLSRLCFHLVNKFSSKALDVARGSTDGGAAIQQWRFHGDENQLWRLIPLGSGTFQILSVRSGKALSIADNSERSQAPAIQWEYAGGAGQKWKLTANLDGTYALQNCGSGKYLDLHKQSDADGVLTLQMRGHAGDSQRWWLVATTGLAATEK